MPSKKSNTGSKSFPHKLHSLLESSSENGFDHIISWQVGGKSFRVHDPKEVVKDILPQYFKQTKFKSFLRQLNIYGFQRIQHGPNKGGYAHQMLVQGMPELCNQIKRVCAPEIKAAAAIANIPEKPVLVRKRSNSSISNMSKVSGLSSLLKNGAGGSTGSLCSLGSLGMNGPEANFLSSGAQNATFSTDNRRDSLPLPGTTISIGDNSLAGSNLTLSRPNDIINFNADDFSAFGKSSGPSKQNGDNMSVLSGLSGCGFSTTSAGGNLGGLNMTGSDLNFIRDILQKKGDKRDAHMLRPDSRKESDNHSLAGNSLNLSRSSDIINFSADDFSAFGKSSVPSKQNGDNMSVLSGLSGCGFSTTSAGGSLGGLNMNGSDLDFIRDILQKKGDKRDVPTLRPETRKESDKHGTTRKQDAEYVVSGNGFPKRKAEPGSNELLGRTMHVPKNEDLNRSEFVFPAKLHRMLQDAKREGFEHIVSWIHGGTAFNVHDVDAFMEKIMPIYFDQSKFVSFRRQLNLYGFTRVTRGPSRGMYYHQDFVQNDVSLCKNITRPKIVRNRRKKGEKPAPVVSA